MLIARDLRVEMGPRVLLGGASFSVQSGDKIGLVGRNGAGKTTLMRVLMGQVAPASGSVTDSGKVGYFSQETVLDELENPDATALERILAARDIGALQRRIEATRLQIAATEEEEDRERLITRFARLQDEFDAKGGFVAEAEAKRTAAALGITDDELSQPVATMSGGQRRRVELTRILFADTDVLLLDEPTNHLDLDAKEWLMDHIANYQGGVLVVSHDLPLLDEAITSVLALEHAEIEVYRGNYTEYLAERDRRRTQRMKERRLQEEKIAQLERNVLRFRGKTEKMARKAKTIETRMNRIKDQLVEVRPVDGKKVAVKFPQPEASGRTPLTANGLGKAFGDNVVFVDVDVDTNRGERLLVVGLNGAGKTTLLRIMAGVETADLGEVELGYQTTLGYYAQEHEQIHSGVGVLDHLRAVSDQPDQLLRGVLGHFRLADKIDQDASTLSGGEKTKLALAMVVLAQPNVLLLDEPTNNLDPQAKDALFEALDQYEGTIILVSHDTDFVAKLDPDRAIIMPEGDHVYYDERLLDLVAMT